MSGIVDIANLGRTKVPVCAWSLPAQSLQQFWWIKLESVGNALLLAPTHLAENTEYTSTWDGADETATVAYIIEKLSALSLFTFWLDGDTFFTVTSRQMGQALPFPFGLFVINQIRTLVARRILARYNMIDMDDESPETGDVMQWPAEKFRTISDAVHMDAVEAIDILDKRVGQLSPVAVNSLFVHLCPLLSVVSSGNPQALAYVTNKDRPTVQIVRTLMAKNSIKFDDVSRERNSRLHVIATSAAVILILTMYTRISGLGTVFKSIIHAVQQ